MKIWGQNEYNVFLWFAFAKLHWGLSGLIIELVKENKMLKEAFWKSLEKELIF